MGDRQVHNGLIDFRFPSRTLEGRVVLVAGGSGGLGRALVVLLLQEGALVVVGFRDNQERAEEFQSVLQAEYGQRVVLVKGDLCTDAVRKDYLQSAFDLGSLDGLVCFPGDPARVAAENLGAQEMVDSWKVNYVGPVLLARDAAQAMATRGGGGIVLISSMQATAPFESSLNYAGPKTALIQAGRILAKQFGPPAEVRVNTIAPGVNQAGMARTSVASGKYDDYLARNVISRFGRAEDVARLARLLLEPGGYITGQVVTIDGGLTLRR